MVNFRHTHSSGRFDRSPESLAKAVQGYLDTGASLLTLTEVQLRSRKKAVKEVILPTHSGAFGDKGNHNDAVVIWQRDLFRVLYTENFKTSDLTYLRHNGDRTKPIYATIAVLEEIKTNKRLVVTAIHLASSVEGDMANRRLTQRTRSWYATFRGAKNRTNVLKKKHRAQASMIVADFNINFKRSIFRILVKALAPKYSITWKNTKVGGGTRGNRIIDATLIRGNITSFGAKLIADDPSSDHRPFSELLRLS